jgi:hypothetical protein
MGEAQNIKRECCLNVTLSWKYPKWTTLGPDTVLRLVTKLYLTASSIWYSIVITLAFPGILCFRLSRFLIRGGNVTQVLGLESKCRQVVPHHIPAAPPVHIGLEAGFDLETV